MFDIIKAAILAEISRQAEELGPFSPSTFNESEDKSEVGIDGTINIDDLARAIERAVFDNLKPL